MKFETSRSHQQCCKCVQTWMLHNYLFSKSSKSFQSKCFDCTPALTSRSTYTYYIYIHIYYSGQQSLQVSNLKCKKENTKLKNTNNSIKSLAKSSLSFLSLSVCLKIISIVNSCCFPLRFLVTWLLYSLYSMGSTIHVLLCQRHRGILCNYSS